MEEASPEASSSHPLTHSSRLRHGAEEVRLTPVGVGGQWQSEVQQVGFNIQIFITS